MSSINDGGPAFPSGPGGASFTGEDGMTTHQFSGCDGMSLRDYFAAHASESDLEARRYPDDAVRPLTREQAKYAYADAMLAARTTTKGGE